ncbi:MAG: DNA polymerase [Polyangiales bacterium]
MMTPPTTSSTPRRRRRARGNPQREFLYPLKRRARKPWRICTFDIESKRDGETGAAGFGRPFALGFYDGVEYREFRNSKRLQPKDIEQHLHGGGCVDEFCEWLFHTKSGLEYTRDKAVIYAHHGGGFDTKFILAWLLDQFDLEFKIVPTMGRIQELIVSPANKPERKWVFRDSSQLMHASLEALAESYGVGKKMEMDLNADEEDPRWSEYLKIDNLMLHGVITRFREIVENDLGGEIHVSAAATALSTWRRKFQDRPIKRNLHEDKCSKRSCRGCLHQWVSKAYYGGRTEVLIPRGRNLFYYDANAAYAHACTFDMPVGDVTVLHGKEEHARWMNDFVNSRVGFIEATVYVPEKCEIPPLPIRHDGKLKFVTGTFRGVWDVEELRLLFHPMVGGKIIEVHKSAWYEARPVMRSFMETLYPIRLKEKQLDAIVKSGSATPEQIEEHRRAQGPSDVAKSMMVALYGKFGTKTDRRNFIRLRPGERPPEGATPLETNDANDYECPIWVVPYKIDAQYIIPQIPAHAAALARVALFFATVDVRERGGNVYYLGTDAIACDVELTESLELGQMRRDNPGLHFQSARFVRAMDYRMKDSEGGEKFKLKGVPLSMVKTGGITIKREGRRAKVAKTQREVFYALENGGAIHFERQEQFLGQLRRYVSGKNQPATPLMKPIRRTALNRDDKRKWMPDGSTRAWVADVDKDGKVTMR